METEILQRTDGEFALRIRIVDSEIDESGDPDYGFETDA